MNEKQQAADELKRFATMLQGIPAIAADLDRLGSLEQAEIEAKSRVDKLQADEQAAKDRVAGFDAEYARKRDDAKQAADQLMAEAEKVRADADGEAAKIVAAANDKASKIVSDAEGKAAKVKTATNEATAEIERLNAEIADRRAQLDQVNSDLAAVRRKISA